MLELEDWKTLVEILYHDTNSREYIENIKKALLAYDLTIENPSEVEQLYDWYLRDDNMTLFVNEDFQKIYYQICNKKY